VFQHIKANDTIDPSLRLVAHNRNSNRTPQSKLLPSESVLTVEELEAQQLDRKVALDEAAVPKPQQQKRGMTVEELEAGVASVGLEQEQDRGYEYGHESGTLMTETGIAVPTVKLRQWREALSIAEVTLLSATFISTELVLNLSSISQIETSPSPSQRLELAAYQLSTFILSHLALKFGLFPVPCPPQSRPSVLLLCTDCEKSNVTLRAGILLANRGCRVVALVEDGKTEQIQTNLRVLSSSGGRIVRDLAGESSRLHFTYSLILMCKGVLRSTSDVQPRYRCSQRFGNFDLPIAFLFAIGFFSSFTFTQRRCDQIRICCRSRSMGQSSRRWSYYFEYRCTFRDLSRRR